jgi:signal transduction histidine kinase
VLDTVERVLTVIEQTEHGERIVFDLAIEPELHVPVSTADLAEILGALVENAVRFARRRVRIAGQAGDGSVIVSIGDDGPGIAAGRTEAALVRGGRLDEAGPGHGFGLAIVADLVDATEGSVRLETSGLGGLEVQLRWKAI